MRKSSRPTRVGIASLGMIASAALIASCSDSGPTAVARVACATGTEVSVDVTTPRPTVNWSPDCAVSFVVVFDTSENNANWAIRAPVSRITSPVEVYSVPSGTYDLAAHRGLIPGRIYEAFIAQRDTSPETGAIGERIVGYTTFQVPDTVFSRR